jgi:hypothetical protein
MEAVSLEKLALNSGHRINAPITPPKMLILYPL